MVKRYTASEARQATATVNPVPEQYAKIVQGIQTAAEQGYSYAMVHGPISYDTRHMLEADGFSAVGVHTDLVEISW